MLFLKYLIIFLFSSSLVYASSQEKLSDKNLNLLVNELRKILIDEHHNIDLLRVISVSKGPGTSIIINVLDQEDIVVEPKNKESMNFYQSEICTSLVVNSDLSDRLKLIDYVKYRYLNSNLNEKFNIIINYDICNNLNLVEKFDDNSKKYKREYIKKVIIPFELANRGNIDYDVNIGDGASIIYSYKNASQVINYSKDFMLEVLCSQSAIKSKINYYDYMQYDYYDEKGKIVRSIKLNSDFCKIN